MALKLFGMAVLAAATLAQPALSQTARFLDYDMAKTMQLSGTVQALDWMNPNSELHLMVKDQATGKSEPWTLVMGPPTRAEKFGWNKNTVKTGDQISVVIYPSVNGAHSGQLVRATLPDGRTLKASEPNPPPG